MDDFVKMQKRAPANLMARIEMQLLARMPIKPVQIKLDKPIASFSFDDIPKTAATNGAKLLEKHGFKGTFYVTGSHANGEFDGVKQYAPDDISELYKNGHEIACHTYAHPRLRRRSEMEILLDLDKNLETMRQFLGDETFEFASHAFPYGEFDKVSRKVLAERFVTSRGVLRAINHGKVDFANLRTTPLERQRFTPEYLKSNIEKAIKNNGWIIFFTHDVTQKCTPYGSTPEILEMAIDAVKNVGIEVLSVKEAANKIIA